MRAASSIPTLSDVARSAIRELPKYLQQGRRLARPERCSGEVFMLMMDCWHPQPEGRPSFAELAVRACGCRALDRHCVHRPGCMPAPCFRQ